MFPGNIPMLEDNLTRLSSLKRSHYTALYQIARDPALWIHYPIDNTFTEEGFNKFFNDALKTGALVIMDQETNKIIGCTRFYNYNVTESSIVIGHTFIARDYWGKGYNKSVKDLMLNYAFAYVEKAVFYVAKDNIRSQKALEKIGAVVKGSMIRNYKGKELDCFVYEIEKSKSGTNP